MKNSDKHYLTIKQFIEKNKGKWPDKERQLRVLIFEAARNGFDKAFFKVGNRVLIDWNVFWDVVDGHRKLQEDRMDNELENLD